MSWQLLGKIPFRFNSVVKISDDTGEYYEFVEYGDDTSLWRRGVRNDRFVLDHALTATGFSGEENIDWENVKLV